MGRFFTILGRKNLGQDQLDLFAHVGISVCNHAEIFTSHTSGTTPHFCLEQKKFEAISKSAIDQMKPVTA